jgi:hypothetical protein
MNRCTARISLGSIAALALAGLGACSLGDSPSDDPSDGGVAGCWMRAAVAPGLPQAPVTVELTASIDVAGGELAGFRTYAWSVWFEDVEQEIAPIDIDGARVAFLAAAPGEYRISLDGEVDSEPCFGWSTILNVTDPGAESQVYRLRLIPPSGQAIPIQEIPQSIATGANVSLGTLVVSPGVAMTGTVEDESGAPLSAYLRVTPRGAAVPWLVESFAGADGSFSLRLESARYDALVVPLVPGHAPITFSDQVSTSPWRLVVPAAPALAGKIVDAQGQPLAGAQVSVGAGDVPAVLATTSDAGEFTVPVRPGSLVGMTVVPPAETGLPWLELPASTALASSAGLATIAYAPDGAMVSFAASARDAGGAPLPGARATWMARPLGTAGSLTVDGQAAMELSGAMRVTVTADAGGDFPALALPAGVYDVILEPAEQGPGAQVSLLSFDLTQAAPASLAVAAPAVLTGKVVDAAGEAVAALDVAAVPLGVLAGSADAGARVQTADDGSFSLEVTAGGSYELVLDGSGHGSGRVSKPVGAPAAGESEDLEVIALPPVTLAAGQLVLLGSGAGAAGVTVQLMCSTCSAPGNVPLAEAVSDALGDFTLRIPVGASAAMSAAPAVSSGRAAPGRR